MNLVVIGGHSRSVGKTSVAAALIAATRERNWTALKLTQYGHGICSASGEPCGCAVEDPECPYAISRETEFDAKQIGAHPGAPSGGAAMSDTARLLRAGASESYWVRAPMGRLAIVLPELERLLAGRDNVLIESNSILEFWQPTLYVPVLRYDVEDFKESNRRFLDRADAFIVVSSAREKPRWPGVDRRILDQKPVFRVEPPEYASADLAAFCLAALQEESVLPETPAAQDSLGVR
ncbi:MAG: hypothetical protein WD733_02980 [Bryobacterales bacterium]